MLLFSGITMVRQSSDNIDRGWNTPRNVLDNPMFQDVAKDIFDILQAAHPNQQWEGILTAEESAINEWSWTGILQALNSRNALDFWFLWHENFSITELKALNLNKIPWLEVTDPMRAAIENAIVACIKSEFSHWLENDIAKKFRDTVKYHNTTLQELLTTIELFENQLNWEEKSKYRKFVRDFSLSFIQIRNNLAAINDPTTHQNINENLDTKSFNDWTDSQKKSFDYLFSKLVLWRLKSRVKRVDSVAENITDTFKLPLSLWLIAQSQEYGFWENGYEDLRNYAAEHLPELYQWLINAKEDELEDIYWEIYLLKIGAINQELSDILRDLCSNNFDTRCLNANPDKRNKFLSILAELRYKEMERAGALDAFWTDHERFKQFFLDLFDFSKREVTINWVSLPIEKELVWTGPIPQFKDLTEFASAANLPVKFSIKWIDNLNLSGDDQELFNKLFQWDIVEIQTPSSDGSNVDTHKDVVLEDSKVWKLLILFLMWNPSIIESYDTQSEQGKKLESFFRNIDKDIAIDKSKRQLDHSEEDENSQEEDIEQEEKDEKKEFLEKWNAIQWDKSDDPDGWFRPWAIFYWPFWESVLPPKTGEAKDWMKVYITDVDWNRWIVKMRSNGVELKLPWDYENKETEMPLSVFKQNFFDKKDKIWEPFKVLSRKDDFEKAYNDFVSQGLCKSDILWESQFEDGKLMIRNRGMDGNEHNEEVKYFTSWLNVPDWDKVVYKIDWNWDSTVTVTSSSFLWEDGARDYKRKMSYPDLLLFIKEKQLSPKTERMAEDEKQKIKDIVSHTTTKLKWVSIWSLIYSFKNIRKTLSDWIDNYNKKQNEECLNLLISKWIFDKVNKWFGWASPALADAAIQAQDKAEKWADKAAWEAIDTWLKEFNGLSDFANFFEKWADAPSGQRLRMLERYLHKNWFKTLKDVVSSWTYVWENDTLRPVIAAAMIANIKKGAGLYRSLAEKDNQWLWIRCLLWPDHYRRYLQMRRQLEDEIRWASWAKAKQLNDLLVQSETTYIINCIENSHGKDKYFWAPSDNNVQALKLMYSNEFASQLSSAVDEWIWESAADKWYSWMKKHNVFDPVWKEVEKNITSWRIDRGIWNIERLWEVAVDNSDFVNLNVAMSFVTLAWILNRKEWKNMRTRFDWLARAYMLPSAFFWEKNENQSNAWHILDKSGCGFTEFMASKWLSLEQFTSSSDNVPYKQLFAALKEWWWANAWKIDVYFESLKTTEQSDPILKKVSEILWEQNPDSISPKWRGKPKITWHYALLASPESIRQNKWYDKGWFSWETDERNDKAAFWSSLKDSLNRAKDNNAKPKFFLNEFKLLFNYEWFWTGNDAENNRMIQMIKEVEERGRTGEPITFQIPDSWKVYSVPTNTSYWPNDYRNLIWYMFKGRVLSRWNSVPPKEFDDVLDFFVAYFTEHFYEIAWDRALLQDVFPVREELPIRKLIPWNEYQDITWWDSNYGDLLAIWDEWDIDSSDKETRNKWLKRLKKKHYKQSSEFYNAEFVDIQKTLKRIWVPATTLSNVAWATGVTFA